MNGWWMLKPMIALFSYDSNRIFYFMIGDYLMIIFDNDYLQIEWLIDGKPVEYANRIMITYEFGYCALDINAVYPRDSGTELIIVSCPV